MRYLWRTREAEICEGPKLALSRNRSQRKRLSAMARNYVVFGDIEGKLGRSPSNAPSALAKVATVSANTHAIVPAARAIG
jgi:hypothetical protein